jgi:ribonuclease P protein component
MLPKRHRLRRTRDISRVRNSRTVARGELFTVRACARSDGQPTRFAIVVSRRVSPKATERNAVTRHVRAFLFHELPTVRDGYDVLIIAQKRFPEYTREGYRRDLAPLLYRLHIVGS